MSAVDAAYALVGQGRAAEALSLLEPLAKKPAADHATLAAHSTVLKALKRHAEALESDRRAAKAWPKSAVAWHNLGATLGDLGRHAEAKQAVERAFGLGLKAPETWLTYARALEGLGALDESERAYEAVLVQAPATLAAATELARVRWMRRGDPAAATAHFARAIAAGTPETPLLWIRAKMLRDAGQDDALRAMLEDALRRRPNDVVLLLNAGQSFLELGDETRALALVEHAGRLAPADYNVLVQRAIVYLAVGRADAALAVSLSAAKLLPDLQSAWGWAAAAARILGDPLHDALYDYDAFVRPYDLPAPAGWNSREAWLRDLSAALRRLHPYEVHPFDQSLRQGTQTVGALHRSEEPAIKAFFQTIDGAIRDYMASVGRGDDPLRRRNTGRYRIAGSWSVWLRPGGRHLDHFHSEGWLSSAFYVETPTEALAREGREGWLRLGKPPYKTVPPLEPERYVRPEPGRLVLFPSYMWHGTEPFTSDERRLTIAFDVAPA